MGVPVIGRAIANRKTGCRMDADTAGSVADYVTEHNLHLADTPPCQSAPMLAKPVAERSARACQARRVVAACSLGACMSFGFRRPVR